MYILLREMPSVLLLYMGLILCLLKDVLWCLLQPLAGMGLSISNASLGGRPWKKANANKAEIEMMAHWIVWKWDGETLEKSFTVTVV